MEPISFLDGISGYMRSSTGNSADKTIRLAVIDPAYNAFAPPYPTTIPMPRVTFEGETTLSGKTYPVAAGVIPQAGNRVYMVPIGTTYLVAGIVAPHAAQGPYANAGGTVVGFEFGGGSYFDIDGGLNIETDADIAGDFHADGAITNGPRAIRIPEIRTGTVSMAGTGASTTVASITATVTFNPGWPVGTSLVIPAPNINSTAGPTAGVIVRAWNISLTSFQITLLQADAGRAVPSGFTGSVGQIPQTFNASVHWVVYGYPPAGT
jgi:hypothetical protein